MVNNKKTKTFFSHIFGYVLILGLAKEGGEK